jgi:DNA-binding transcriptional LysR family regulator
MPSAASPAAGGVPNGRSVLPGEAGFSPRIRYEGSTLYGLLDLVHAGLGVALVPTSAALLLVRRQDQRPLIQALGTATEALFASLHQRPDLPHGPC